MELTQDQLQLSVTVYDKIEKVSDTLSKSRVRIFYKFLNRNDTYISEDFANQLISSLPYTPIKGIFDQEALDFTDHGDSRTDGKIYGVVPENPNFAWEQHIDADGVEREYACADVLLFTGIYPEAKLIQGKPQSMELNSATLKGEWRTNPMTGGKYYHFISGGLLGLSVLGEEVEPCFEGAAFYNLHNNIKELCDYIKQYEKQEDEKKMENKNLFRLSDEAKCELLFNALNASEEDCFSIMSIYDDYCLAYDFNSGNYVRVYYTKDNDAETVSLDTRESVRIVDVTETEFAALEAMKAIGTYEDINSKVASYENKVAEFEATETALRESIASLNTELEAYKNSGEEVSADDSTSDDTSDVADNATDSTSEYEAKIAELEAKISEYELKNVELATEIDTYKLTVEEKEAEIVRLNSSLDDINNEKSELAEFKKKVESDEKQSILDEFASHLGEEQISEFAAKMSDYSVVDFKKEVCFAAYNADPSFTKKGEKDESGLIYKNSGKDMSTGALKLLNKYKGGNK